MAHRAWILLAILALAAVAIAADAPAPAQQEASTEATTAKKHKHHSSGHKDDDSYDDKYSKKTHHSYEKEDKYEKKSDSYDKYEKKSDSYDKDKYKEKTSYKYEKEDDKYHSYDKDYKKKPSHSKEYEKKHDYKQDYYTKDSYDYKNSYSGYDSDYYSSPDGWHDGEGDCNRPWDHIDKHKGDCMANRHVTVSAGTTRVGGLLQPLNYADGCPSGTATGNTISSPVAVPKVPCNVPEFCGASGSGSTAGSCACLTENGAAPGTYPDYLRYEQSNVEQHFWNQPAFTMVDDRKHTWECVDARGEHPMLGTPGGDLAEAMAAAMAIMYLQETAFSTSIADKVFHIFAEDVAGPERPLYFHTDDTRLRQMFITLRNTGNLNANEDSRTNPIPSAFPFRGPAKEDPDREKWLDALATDTYNGCGHVREMLSSNTKKYYSVDVDKPVATACTASTETCIDAQIVAKFFIKKFFSFWWFTPSGSWQRKHVAFVTEDILEGPLQGKAVAIIGKNPKTACSHETPLVRPNFGGSQVFVYHGDAVGEWREYVVNEYLADYIRHLKLSTDDVLDAWNKIAGMQLGATLAYLNPANKVGQWAVGVDVKPYEPSEYSDSKYDSK